MLAIRSQDNLKLNKMKSEISSSKIKKTIEDLNDDVIRLISLYRCEIRGVNKYIHLIVPKEWCKTSIGVKTNEELFYF